MNAFSSWAKARFQTNMFNKSNIIGGAVLGSILLSLTVFVTYKIATFDPRPAVVQAAEVELQELLPRYRQAEAEFNALKADKERTEKTLRDWKFSFDEEQLRAVEEEEGSFK
jgi:3-hydroxyacyl-CoA dehydrogenase